MTKPSRIDNTSLVYQELLSILNTQNLSKIAVNTSPDISFSSGLHVGELSALSKHLGEEWTSRFVSVPMVAVEFVASKVPDQLEWYRKLQSTAWAMIKEGFSEKVITPGETTTEVPALYPTLPGVHTLLSLILFSGILTKEPGRRMAPPLQAPGPELHYMVPPGRHNPHQPACPVHSIPSSFKFPAHSQARSKSKKYHPTRRSPPRRLRRHSPRPKHRHPTPRLRPPPNPNFHPFRT